MGLTETCEITGHMESGTAILDKQGSEISLTYNFLLSIDVIIYASLLFNILRETSTSVHFVEMTCDERSHAEDIVYQTKRLCQ